MSSLYESVMAKLGAVKMLTNAQWVRYTTLRNAGMNHDEAVPEAQREEQGR